MAISTKLIALDQHLRELFLACTGVQNKREVYTAQWNGSQTAKEERDAAAIIAGWDFTELTAEELKAFEAKEQLISEAPSQLAADAFIKRLLVGINECREQLGLKALVFDEEKLEAAKLFDLK